MAFGILGLKYLTFDAAPISWDKLWLEVNRKELCNIAGLCSWKSVELKLFEELESESTYFQRPES